MAVAVDSTIVTAAASRIVTAAASRIVGDLRRSGGTQPGYWPPRSPAPTTWTR